MATVSIVEVILRARDEASRVLQGVGKEIEASAGALKTVGAVSAGAGLAIGGALGAAVKAASGFESQMSGVKAVMSPAEVQEFGGALEQLALRLGKDTAFSATAAAQGIEELVKAGVPAKLVLQGAGEAALALAAAGGVSLPKAAEVASNALNAFKIPADQMGRAVNTLAGAANASASDIGELQFGMQAASAVAATVGLTLEDTAGTLALLSNNALKGSDAGTSLKTMLMNLQPGTKAQNAEFSRLGITTLQTEKAFGVLANMVENDANAMKAWERHTKAGTGTLDNLYKVAGNFALVDKDVDFNKWAFDAGFMGNQFFDASGKAKSMSDISGVLAGSLEGMTEQQKLASLEIMFGSDAVRAAAILSREGAEGFDTMTAAIAKVEAGDVAKTRLDNLAGATEAMKGSLETAAIEIGNRIIPTVRILVEQVTGLLNRFLELPGPVKDAIVVAGVIAAALLTLGGTIALFLPVVLGLGGAFAAVAALTMTTLVPALAALWTALLGPLGLAIAAVVIAVGLLYLAWQSNFGGIQEIVATAWKSIRGVFALLGGALSAFGETILPDLQRAWEAVTNRVSAVWAWLMGDVGTSLEGFRGTWEAIWGVIALVVGAVWDNIAAVVGALWEVVQGIVLAGLKVLQGDWAGAWQALADHLGAAGNIIAGRVNELVGGVKDLLNKFLATLPEVGAKLPALLVEGIDRASGGLITSVRRLVGDVAALLPHSLAEEGPLSRPTRWTDVLLGDLPQVSDSVIAAIGDAVEDMELEWDSLLQRFRTNRQGMATELDTLVADFQEQVPLITAAVSDIADEPDSLLRRFRSVRVTLSEELDTLAADFAEQVTPVTAAVADIADEPDSLLRRFRAVRADMGTELVALSTDFSAQVAPVTKAVADIDTAADSLLSQFRTNRQGLSGEWAQLSTDVATSVTAQAGSLTALAAAEANHAAILTAARREPYRPTTGSPVTGGTPTTGGTANAQPAAGGMLRSWMETRNGKKGEVQEYSWGQKWIPYFALGGIVPGPLNAPTLAVVHGGERITPAGRGGAASGTGNTYVYQQNAPVYGIDNLEEEVTRLMIRAEQRGRVQVSR